MLFDIYFFGWLLHVVLPSCGEQGLLFAVMPRLLTAVASLVAELRL